MFEAPWTDLVKNKIRKRFASAIVFHFLRIRYQNLNFKNVIKINENINKAAFSIIVAQIQVLFCNEMLQPETTIKAQLLVFNYLTK